MNWQIYGIWLAITSFITFILYGYDKVQAKTGGWRIPEVILHSMALAGGFPGGWAGRTIFRHKTQKGVFAFILAISTIGHMGLVYWLFFGRTGI
jgi:uncharacterized membrane protein YsdA (DUF1294 family)